MVSFQIQDLIVPLFLIVLFIIFLKKRHPTTAATPRKNSPPSPKKLPIIGHLHQLGEHPHRSLKSFSNDYGELMLLHFGNVPVLVVSSAEAAHEVMKNQDVIFSNRPKQIIPERLIYGSRDVAFAPYGEYWRQVKSICVVQLLSHKRVQSYRRVREEETSAMVEKIQKMASSSSSSSAVINLSDAFVDVTNDVVSRVALGRRCGDDGEGKKFKSFLGEFVEVLGVPNIGDYVPWLGWISWVNGLDVKVARVAKRFDEFLESILEEHRKKTVEKLGNGDMDFVDILLEFQRESNEAGSSTLEDDTIKALIMDMFAAGTDTTSSLLEWTAAELIRNPRAMKILQNEVRGVAGTKREITEDDIEKMPYLKAVFKESLRLHAPVPLLVPRESTRDIKVMGYDIASGTRVLVNAWAIGRDPSLWENPEEFRPERFLNSSTDFKGVHFELIPFGAGRRGCPGIAFAMSVDELALAKLVHKFDFGLPGGGRMEDLDVSEATGITVHKKFPLFVETTPYAG